MSSSKIVFFGRNGRPGGSVKKVAHSTQVHDMWPFGPIIYYLTVNTHFFFALKTNTQKKKIRRHSKEEGQVCLLKFKLVYLLKGFTSFYAVSVFVDIQS